MKSGNLKDVSQQSGSHPRKMCDTRRKFEHTTVQTAFSVKKIPNVAFNAFIRAILEADLNTFLYI